MSAPVRQPGADVGANPTRVDALRANFGQSTRRTLVLMTSKSWGRELAPVLAVAGLAADYLSPAEPWTMWLPFGAVVLLLVMRKWSTRALFIAAAVAAIARPLAAELDAIWSWNAGTWWAALP